MRGEEKQLKEDEMPYELSEEQTMFRENTKRFAREKLAPLAAEIDKKGEFPHEAFNLLLEMVCSVWYGLRNTGGQALITSLSALLLRKYQR